ncbi:hypothetical protein D7Y23_14345 [Corallococcus sp. AB050B]|nr:hypothetical protein D7Y23_14345 [Corallococcus sp. AB050B]
MPTSPPDSEPARSRAAPFRHALPPMPGRPRPLFTIDGVRYEAVRELVRMQTGEVLMLARRIPERGAHLSGLCFVRRLANPSTTPRRTRLGAEIQWRSRRQWDSSHQT